MAKAKKTPGDQRCKVKGCEKTYKEHSGKKCPSCGDPIEHHFSKAEEDECWAGHARLARARRDAGVSELVYMIDGAEKRVRVCELNEADRESLRRYPNPERLTSTGYRVVEDDDEAISG